MKSLIHLLLLCLALSSFACDAGAGNDVSSPAETTKTEADGPKPGEKFMKDGKKTIILEAQPWPVGNGNYPAAEGFNAAGSDPKAIRLADSIVKYHGGWDAYENTRYLSWDFFGARQLSWDKWKDRVRIDQPAQETVYLLDFSEPDSLRGRVQRRGEEMTGDSLAILLDRAHSMWINDSYWLVQQFKLKDSGTTLKFAGEVRTDPQASRPSYLLDQTFSEVGDTPRNRYRLFVDKVTYRINTWQFFRDADDTEPAMETPWKGYVPNNGLVLSGDRGGRYQLGAINVSSSVPDRTFTEF